jgi:hypothetical protein
VTITSLDKASVAVVQSTVGGSASNRILKTLCFEVEEDFFVQETKEKETNKNKIKKLFSMSDLNLHILSS